MTLPTPRGFALAVGLVIVVVAAASTATPELVPLAVVIGLPLVVAPLIAGHRARVALASMALHAHVDPAMAGVGGHMQVQVAVTNRATGGGRPPALGLPVSVQQWRVRGSPVPVPLRRQWLAPSILDLMSLPTPGPGRTEHGSLAVPTRRRGVFELPPQQCWAHDPFGLFGSHGPFSPAVIAVVHPVPADPGVAITALSSTTERSGALMASGSTGGLGELEGIRPYVPGDRLSLLHWPAKARYGTWFVRQFAGETERALPLVVDDRAGVHRRADFDRLVAATLSTVDNVLRDGRAVALYTLTGRATSFEPTEQGHAEARLLLAQLQPSVSPSSAGPRLGIPAGVVVFTTRSGAERLTPPGEIVEVSESSPPSPGPGTGSPRLVVI